MYAWVSDSLQATVKVLGNTVERTHASMRDAVGLAPIITHNVSRGRRREGKGGMEGEACSSTLE